MDFLPRCLAASEIAGLSAFPRQQEAVVLSVKVANYDRICESYFAHFRTVKENLHAEDFTDYLEQLMVTCLKHNGDVLNMTADFISVSWNIKTEGSADEMVMVAYACLVELHGVGCELSTKLMDLEMVDFKEGIILPHMTFGLAYGTMTLFAGGDESTRIGLLVGGPAVLDSIKALGLCDPNTRKLVGTNAVAGACGDVESSEIPGTAGFCNISLSESMAVQDVIDKNLRAAPNVPDSPFLRRFLPQGIEKYGTAQSSYVVGNLRFAPANP
jgi:hypothetical protein